MTGVLNVKDQNGDWVPISTSGPQGPPGPQGPEGQWVQLTQVEYDQLAPGDANTLYVIVG